MSSYGERTYQQVAAVATRVTAAIPASAGSASDHVAVVAWGLDHHGAVFPLVMHDGVIIGADEHFLLITHTLKGGIEGSRKAHLETRTCMCQRYILIGP